MYITTYIRFFDNYLKIMLHLNIVLISAERIKQCSQWISRWRICNRQSEWWILPADAKRSRGIKLFIMVFLLIPLLWRLGQNDAHFKKIFYHISFCLDQSGFITYSGDIHTYRVAVLQNITWRFTVEWIPQYQIACMQMTPKKKSQIAC